MQISYKEKNMHTLVEQILETIFIKGVVHANEEIRIKQDCTFYR